jgi:hypothetical protein
MRTSNYKEIDQYKLLLKHTINHIEAQNIDSCKLERILQYQKKYYLQETSKGYKENGTKAAIEAIEYLLNKNN